MCEINFVHSREIERAVLAILMMLPDKIAEITDFLESGDFYYKRDQIIFSTICQAHAQGLAVDLVLLCHYLEQKGLLAECGGATYLASILDGVSVKAVIKNLTQYCMELRRLRILRNIQKYCYRAMLHGFEEDLTAALNEIMRYFDFEKEANHGRRADDSETGMRVSECQEEHGI